MTGEANSRVFRHPRLQLSALSAGILVGALGFMAIAFVRKPLSLARSHSGDADVCWPIGA